MLLIKPIIDIVQLVLKIMYIHVFMFHGWVKFPEVLRKWCSVLPLTVIGGSPSETWYIRFRENDADSNCSLFILESTEWMDTPGCCSFGQYTECGCSDLQNVSYKFRFILGDFKQNNLKIVDILHQDIKYLVPLVQITFRRIPVV